MAPTLELTKARKKKIEKIQEKLELLLKLFKEISDPEKFRLYASGKSAIEKGEKGIPAEDLLKDLQLK